MAKEPTVCAPEDLVIIGVDTPDGAEHPLYDVRINAPLKEEFIRNVRHLGVLQPVVVTQMGEKIVVVAGRQRVRAAREASRRNIEEGLPAIRVPIIFRRGETTALFPMAIAENEHRLGDSPQARAAKIQKLLDYGYSREEAAEAFGIGPVALDALLTLLAAPQEVREAVAAGNLAVSTVPEIAKLPEEAQKELVQEASPGHPVRRADVRQRRAAVKGANLHIPQSKRIVARVLKHEKLATLPPAFVDGIRWVLGALEDTQVPEELRAILKDIATMPAKKRGAKEEATPEGTEESSDC